MNKQELRTLFLGKRLLLTSEELQRKSNILTQQILTKIEEIKPAQVLIFLPIESKKEFDCKALAQQLWQKGISTAIPVTDFKTKEMQFAVFDSNTELEQKKLGITEPKNPVISIDFGHTLAIVPLLAFDLNGYRVGYGGGFYDRFFAKKPSVYKLGVSFFDAVQAIDDLDEFDVVLDGVVFL